VDEAFIDFFLREALRKHVLGVYDSNILSLSGEFRRLWVVLTINLGKYRTYFFTEKRASLVFLASSEFKRQQRISCSGETMTGLSSLLKLTV
jgi:hypothetical protein